MSKNSAIEWTDHTFNPWEGCQKVSPGCDHCYAETRNARFSGGTAINWGPGAPRRRTSVSNWRKPIAWNAEKFWQCECGWRGADIQLDREAESASNLTGGIPACPGCNRIDLTPARARVFCASLADVFDNAIDPLWRQDLFQLIRATPNLDWLLLTKRIGNVNSMLPGHFLAVWPNVWIGATIVSQEEADRDIPKLLAVPAARRFLSMEPLLGPVDLTRIDLDGHREIYPLSGTGDCEDDDGNRLPDLPALDWVIVGGESGAGARPMHPEWVRELRDQCDAAGVPFLFKQWGEWAPHEARPGGDEGGDLRRGHVRYLEGDGRDPDGRFRRGDAAVARVGKKAAGRLLDGVQHDGYPGAK